MAFTRTNTYSVNTSNDGRKTVGDPNFKYESLAPIWKRNRAVLGGEQTAKEYDRVIQSDFSNLLIPFSPTMSPFQYAWYKSEAELPGVTAQFAKTIIGGMLRKSVDIVLPDDAPEDAMNWLRNRFTDDNKSIQAFLDDALWEEMNTSRAWVCVNYPENDQPSSYDGGPAEPYPILISGESVINWQMGEHPLTGETNLQRIIIRMYTQEYNEESPYHPDFRDTVWVHELDDQGYYQIITYQYDDTAVSTGVVAGQLQQDYRTVQRGWVEVETETNIMQAGERLTHIPIFPLNGQVEPMEPLLSTFIEREVGLYNKISRRNHLLYGAATYTPILKSNLTDDEKEEVVSGGLGSWVFVDREDSVEILESPSTALQSYQEAISSTMDEMARMGMRMLAAEQTAGDASSGVALELRNAGQTAQLSSLSRMISSSLRKIVVTMINWRYDLDYTEDDMTVTLSTDLTPVPIGEEYMRIAGEWYQAGILPRSTFLEILKINDFLPPEYNDEEAMEEINEDELVMSPAEQQAQEMEMQETQMEMNAELTREGIAAQKSNNNSGSN